MYLSELLFYICKQSVSSNPVYYNDAFCAILPLSNLGHKLFNYRLPAAGAENTGWACIIVLITSILCYYYWWIIDAPSSDKWSRLVKGMLICIFYWRAKITCALLTDLFDLTPIHFKIFVKFFRLHVDENINHFARRRLGMLVTQFGQLRQVHPRAARCHCPKNSSARARQSAPLARHKGCVLLLFYCRYQRCLLTILL